ncbi:MAG: hypothetical protein J0M15_12035 [Deltaproteobacteria bacterium]|jgi:hypothetical protein|nr:hypothetical protein [Deltaproteobacteria bacterium]
MKKFICSLLTLSLTQIVFAYEVDDSSNPLCNNEAKLTYFWNKEERYCQSEIKIKETHISITAENGVFVIKTDQGETVNAFYDKTLKSLPEKYGFASKNCGNNRRLCFVEKASTNTTEDKLKVRMGQTLEAFPTNDKIDSDLAYIFKFEAINCQKKTGETETRLIIREPKTNKIFAALTSDTSFRVEETWARNNEDACKKLNTEKRNQNSIQRTSPPGGQKSPKNNSPTNT